MKHLVLMVKEPRPGRVKTRLGRDIGMTQAAWWFRHQTRQIIRRLDDPRWTLWLAVSPDVQGMTSRIWPAHLPRIPQGSGDLGDRMARIFRSLPTGPACIVGADIPGITPNHIQSAFDDLASQDVVIGPAPDGGYWLIGLKRTAAVPASLFTNTRWSTEHARADTLASLNTNRVATTATLSDIDTAADLSLHLAGKTPAGGSRTFHP